MNLRERDVLSPVQFLFMFAILGEHILYIEVLIFLLMTKKKKTF